MPNCHARFCVSRDNAVTLFSDKPITTRKELENIIRMLSLDLDLFEATAIRGIDAGGEGE